MDVEAIKQLAEQCESNKFIKADPSTFMHQVYGNENREVTAFVASCLSYGSRKQFMPKISHIVRLADGNVYLWIKDGKYKTEFKDTDDTCFYRLYKKSDMYRLFCIMQIMLKEWGSIGNYVKSTASDGLSSIKALTSYFATHGTCKIIPKDTKSPCKRLCMFLRWMVRDNSLVDLGLWKSFIDKRTLIIPMDTHVRQEAIRLGLMQDTRSVTMRHAILLTSQLSKMFPDDPLKADFALFGPVTLL